MEYPIQQPCEQGQKNLYSDLCAQWYAAEAAHDGAWWNRFQAWLAIVGTIFVAASVWLAYRATNSAADAVGSANAAVDVATEALSHAAKSNEIAVNAFVQDRGMAKLAFEDFVRAREPSAFVVGMTLDNDWPAMFDNEQDVFLTVVMRNTGMVVARRVGLALNRVVVRDFEGEILFTGVQRERLSPVRPGMDTGNTVKLQRNGGLHGRAHNIEVIGHVEVLGDMAQQRPEPFRWVSDILRGGGALVETWPEDEPYPEDSKPDAPAQLPT